MVDHRTGVRRATEHLLQLGHRRIALITGHQPVPGARAHRRIRGRAQGVRRQAVPDLMRKESFLADYAFQQTSILVSTGRRRPRSSPAASTCCRASCARCGRAACGPERHLDRRRQRFRSRPALGAADHRRELGLRRGRTHRRAACARAHQRGGRAGSAPNTGARRARPARLLRTAARRGRETAPRELTARQTTASRRPEVRRRSRARSVVLPVRPCGAPAATAPPSRDPTRAACSTRRACAAGEVRASGPRWGRCGSAPASVVRYPGRRLLRTRGSPRTGAAPG